MLSLEQRLRKSLELSPTETKLLLLLKRYGEDGASGAELAYRSGISESAVRVHLHNLRRKIGPACITSGAYLGYRLSPQGAYRIQRVGFIQVDTPWLQNRFLAVN